MTAATGIGLVDGWLAGGREVAVVGLGKSGVAASLLLRDFGVPVYASDTGSSAAHQSWAETVRAAGAAVEPPRPTNLERSVSKLTSP